MAWLKGQQPAAQFVRNLLDSTQRREQTLVMNIVNLGEVFYLSAKARDLAYGQRVLSGLRPILLIESATDELVVHAARLKAGHAISYTDAFAAATAIAREAPLVTGDAELRAVATVEQKLKLQWIGA
jgi:predicted nucleic acid-binding protein